MTVERWFKLSNRMSEKWLADPLPTHPDVIIWRFWLTHLAGWTEDQVLAFAERWRDRIFDENSMYHHELPEYWVSPQLVPCEIGDAQPPVIVERLAWVVQGLIERYRKTYGLTTEHLGTLRTGVEQATRQRLLELQPFITGQALRP